MNIPDELKNVLDSTPDTLHGAIRFASTHVPLEVFLDTMAEGISLDRFLSGYPTVSREQALAVLEWQSAQTRKTIGIEAA